MTKEPHGTTRVDGIYQFLLKVHQRILQDCKSPEQTYQEGSPVGVDRRKRRSVPNAQKNDLRRTSAPHAKVGATI